MREIYIRASYIEGNYMKTQLNTNVADLKKHLNGKVILPDDANYDELRRIWNAMIDRRPCAIVRCADANDVQHSIEFAHKGNQEISIRGAGHNIAGNAVCNNGILIDLSGWKNVRVDAVNKRAYVDPGATLGDFDKAAQAHGLATPVGINSTTGIAGLTLGGGFGWLTRLHGLTIDNLVSAEIITADGKKITADQEEHSDLFWAIRGGGGNFGVVTRFEFKLHPLGPEILAGLIVYPFSQAKQVLTQYRDFMDSAPIDLNAWVVLRDAPPLPFLPDKVHGEKVVVLPVFYSGEISSGRKLIQPLRGFGDVLGEHVGPMPYVQWQQAFDGLLTPGARNYWKSHNLSELHNGLLDSMIKYGGTEPSPQCEIFLGCIAGEANKLPPDATAYGARDARFVMNVHARWDEASQDEKCIAWARNFFKDSAAYASTGAYVNFMTEDESARVESAYGSNYARLKQIKRKYDPENFFHLNQNIKP
jgi:FAD/FMN-containing dehydrogenase